eukprot:TRINITY_DN1478_c0_g1_i1.p1 TRINITY_DN1478_c0_g1~~TRINITY_DN1478_c0_g1_i1.p1  ORF type:complete len:869 (+),score=260.55 TRINITY_DN1478_c0_g1_i1:64-2607(+)
MRAAALLLAAAGAAGQITCEVSSYLGCYTDTVDKRDLIVGPLSLSGLTQESCAAECARGGSAISGVEFGVQCFCGDALVAGSKVDDAQCAKMKCPGNASQSCGDADRLLAYRAKCTGTPLPNYHGCTDPKAKALPYCDTSLPIEARVDDLVSRLSLSERVAAISPQPKLGETCGVHTAGKADIGLPDYFWLVETNTAVAAACYRPEKCATTFIGPMGIGASFNRTSWRLKGEVLGTEMRAFQNAGWHRGNAGDHIALTGFGPNINVARDPRFGRSSELPGEDPFLSGTYAKHMVQGMQEEDSKGHPKMLAYLKHFTAYSRETDRGHDTYNISMHDLHETYLAQYRIAFIEGKATGAMCSYDAENGRPSCANDYILNEMVRKRWQRPEAHITTDCGAVSNLKGPPVNAPSDEHAAAYAINNGTDLEMGSEVWTSHLESAVAQKLTTAEAVENATKRAFRVLMKAGRFDPVESVEWTSIKPDAINSTLHQQIAYEAALQGLVLLSNDGVLPLRKGGSIAVVGPMGQARGGLLSDYAGDQWCFDGSDSCIPSIADAITAAHTGGATTQAKGVDVSSKDASGIAPAVALAKAADAVVLVLGIDKPQEHEGHDRSDTALPGLQESFAQQVLALGRPTVLVLCNGGALAIDNLLTGPHTPNAIVEAFNPSLNGAAAVAASIFGDENRWGKLPVTMYPHSFISENPMTNYDMAKPPGRTYRYYTGTPLYPFGHGLSLTTFTLNCTASGAGLPLSVSCAVANTGAMRGDEVVMLYHSAGDDVRAQAKHPCPKKSLKDFARVTVAQGSSVGVSFPVTQEQIMMIDENGDDRLYKGTHYVTASRGHGPEFKFPITVQ